MKRTLGKLPWTPRLRTVLTLGLALVVIGAWVQAYFAAPLPLAGSRPGAQPPASDNPQQAVSVSEIQLIEPSSSAAPYRIEATLQRLDEAGPVDVTFRLRDRQTDERIERTGQVQLRPGAALVAVTEITAPRADYAPEVEVRSPTR